MLWCDTCWPLDSQHCSHAFSILVLEHPKESMGKLRYPCPRPGWEMRWGYPCPGPSWGGDVRFYSCPRTWLRYPFPSSHPGPGQGNLLPPRPSTLGKDLGSETSEQEYPLPQPQERTWDQRLETSEQEYTPPPWWIEQQSENITFPRTLHRGDKNVYIYEYMSLWHISRKQLMLNCSWYTL